MALLDKQKLLAFSKKKATPPLAATALAAKRAQAVPVNPLPGNHASPPMPGAAPKPGTPGAAPPGGAKVMPMRPPPADGAHQEPHAPVPGDDQEAHIFDLVEPAAQAAEGSLDPELEDLIASAEPTDSGDMPPPWATNAEMWKEAAEAVGLGMGAEDMYEEPFVVTAYLYKMIGGEIQGGGIPQVDAAGGAPGAPQPEADVTKKGGAAAAIAARAKARSAPPPPSAKPTDAPAAPPKAPPVAAKPPAPKPTIPPGAKGPPKPPAAAPPAAAKPPVPGAPKPGAPAAKGPPAPPGKGAPPPAAAAPGGKPPDAKAPAKKGGDDHSEAMGHVVDHASETSQTAPDAELSAAMQSEEPQEGSAPSWAEDAAKWAKAEAAVKPKWDTLADPMLAVAHVYKSMGGKVAAKAPAAAPVPPPR
jgi:hypothetical protein